MEKGSDNPDLRQVFVESCQMYRHYILMRYYVLGACGVFSGALIAAWVQKDQALRPYTAVPICVVGMLLLIAGFLIDLRLAVVADHFAKQCDTLGSRLTGNRFLDERHHTFRSVWVPSVALGLTLLGGTIAWIWTLVAYLTRQLTPA
jgi:hypothetical protein